LADFLGFVFHCALCDPVSHPLRHFRDSHHIILYLIGDIAFLPIQVLLVTLIIDRLLSAREKQAMLKKMNMVIGAFFSEVGSQLLKSFSCCASFEDQISKDLVRTTIGLIRHFPPSKNI